MAAFRATRLADLAAPATAATMRVGILARPPARATTATEAAMSRNGTTTLSRRAMTTAAPPPNGPNPANAKRFQWIRDLFDDLFTVPTPKEYFERGWRIAVITAPAWALLGMGAAPSNSTFSQFYMYSFAHGIGAAAITLVAGGFIVPVTAVALTGTAIRSAWNY